MFNYTTMQEEPSVQDSTAIGAGTGANLLQHGLNVGNNVSLSPITIIVAMIVAVVALKILGETGKSDIQPAHFAITFYNALATTLVVGGSILGVKLAANSSLMQGIPGVPALATVVNAI